MTDEKITLENCCIEHRNADGTITQFGYADQPPGTIRSLMEKYLLPPKDYLEQLNHPEPIEWPVTAS